MKLKFEPQLILIGIYNISDEKTQIFTAAERSQSLHFWFNFGPNLPHEGVRNRGKSMRSEKKFIHRANQISKN